MRPALKEYFTFNNREKRGILLLSVLIVVLIGAMNTVHLWVPRQHYDHTQFASQLAQFEAAKGERQAQKNSYGKKRKYNNSYASRDKAPAKPAERFAFNPNNLPVADWVRLGLSEKQARAIHKYEAAGGSFRKPEDVQRMYTVSDELYAELKPWIKIPEPEPSTSKPSSYTASWGGGAGKSEKKWANKKKEPYKKYEPPMMEVNSATAEDLDKLRGIGAVLSERIVKYRDARGGFQTIDQLLDIYGIKPEVLEENRKYLTIVPAPIKKININTCTAEELQHHCHIRWKVVNAIIAYREHHGSYLALEDLRKCKLVDGEIFSKIAPVLEL